MVPSIPALTHPSAPPPTWRIDLELLDSNPHQPRSRIDDGALAELTASIRDHGLLQPITVRKVGARYQVIAGHRRLEAFRRLRAGAGEPEGAERYRTIPAHEKFDVTDDEMALFALVENLQRDDLSALDAALGLARFQETHQLSTEALAKRTGLELDRVKRLLRLARAPKVVQDACHEGVMVEASDTKPERSRLDLMAALEFAKLHAHAMKSSPKKADERTVRAIERALSERWSFRRVQAFCRASVEGANSEVEVPAQDVATPLFRDGRELRIFRVRIKGATHEERGALRQLLAALLEELAL